MSHKDTYKYYQELHELDENRAHKDYGFQLDVNKEKQRYDDLVADNQDRLASEKWAHEKYMRDFKHSTQLEAYAKSQHLAQQQFDLTRRSAELSLAAQARVSYERKRKLEFEMGAAKIKARNAQFKLQEQKGMLQHHQNAQHAKHMIASVESLSKLIQKQGKIVGRGQSGRTAMKESDAIDSEYGRMESAKYDMLTRSDEQYQAKMYGTDFAIATLSMGRRLQKEAEALTYESILDAHDKSVAEILLKKEATDVQTEGRKMLKPRLQNMPPQPKAVPRTIILDPPAPEKTPAPVGGEQPNYRGQGSGYSRNVAQQSGFNAGSAMITGGSIMAAAGGAAAMGAFGAGLAGLSILGPIGIGIALVGFFGKIFNWW